MSIDELAREAGLATSQAAGEMPLAPIAAVRLARRRRAWAGAVAAAVATVLIIGVPLVLVPAAPEVGPASTVVEPSTTVPETTVPETTVPPTTVPETTVPPTTVPETTVPETTVPDTTVPPTTVPPPATEASCNLVTHDGHEIPDAVVETCRQLVALIAAEDVAGLDALTGSDFMLTLIHIFNGKGWQAAFDYWDDGTNSRMLSEILLESLSFTPRPTEDGRYYWPGWLNIYDWNELNETEKQEVLVYFETTIEEIEAPGFFTVEEWYSELVSEKPFWIVIDQEGTILFVGHQGS